jgi:hypothetical protein
VGAAIGSATAYVASADGSGAREVATDAYQPPAFTADGGEIAVNIGLGCRLRLVPTGGGAARLLPFEACQPVWKSG